MLHRRYSREIELERHVALRLADEFEIDLYAAHVEHDTQDVDLLVELGDLYTRAGRVEEGIEIDKKLVNVCPEEPVFHYNLACSQSLLGQTDLALGSLRSAIEFGYRNLDLLETDADLQSVREDPRFPELIESIFRKFEPE